MASIMSELGKTPPAEIAGSAVCEIRDYKASVAKDLKTGKERRIELPSSDVLEFRLDNGCSLFVLPTGTEPKIKIYLSSNVTSKAESIALCNALKAAGDKLMNK